MSQKDRSLAYATENRFEKNDHFSAEMVDNQNEYIASYIHTCKSLNTNNEKNTNIFLRQFWE